MSKNKTEKINIVNLSCIGSEDWLRLWQAYQSFYKTSIAADVSNHTWQKLCNPELSHIYGFAAILKDKVVGIVHVIEHDSCWTIAPYAYLQDLYVDEQNRRLGIARALIEHVYDMTKQKGCDRVYWLTHESNIEAQYLYDRVARKTGFIQYRSI